MLPPPTTRQMIMLRFIQTFNVDKGRPPTFRELSIYANVRSLRTVAEHIYTLRRKGMLLKPDRPAQENTLKLTELGTVTLAEWDPPKLVDAYVL